MTHTIGLDLGGTNIKGGVVRGGREVVVRHSIPTEADRGPEHVLDRLAELARDLARRAGLDWRRVGGVGVGTPGPIDDDGVVLEAPNLPGWKNVPLRSALAERLGAAVSVVNDANAAALGEFRAGAGQERSVTDMILLTLGTGVGGGVICGGRLFVGAHNAGAELGHTIVHISGRACPCGQRGCLEPYASATAIVAEARRRIAERERGSSLADAARAGGLTCEAIFQAAEHGDALAEAVIDEATRYLGAACVNYVRAFDPQLIVLGGGVVAAGESLIRRVDRWFRELTWHVRPENVVITAATLGNDAGFIGAAAMAAGDAP